MKKSLNSSRLRKILLYRINKDFTFEDYRDKIFAKPATLCHYLSISPNALSIFGVIFLVIAVLLLDYPIIATSLIIINLIADGLDGVIARLYNLKTFFGSIIDTVCDTLGSIIIVVGFSVFYNLSKLNTTLWIISIIVYSLVTAIYSIKVQQRSKVIGFRNLINVGAIALLILISTNSLVQNQIPMIIDTYMKYISISLIALSLYASVKLTIILKSKG